MDEMVKGFLARLEYQGEVRPDLDTLAALQRRHLEKIPYENLDILHQIPLEFGTEALWQKIVARRRGGVCYELNFLFGDMLRRMGFQLDLLSGIVAGGVGGDFAHGLLLVHLPQGDWIADVGFAKGFLAPLRLDEGWQSDGRCRYRLRREGEWRLLERETPEGTPAEEYRFRPIPRRREEYREMCDFLCASPKCKFTYMLVCSLELPEGRLTLRDDHLLLERPGFPPERVPVSGPEERAGLLRKRFGLMAEAAERPKEC